MLPFHDTLEDPANPGTMKQAWTIDGDHPSVEGYRLLAEQAVLPNLPGSVPLPADLPARILQHPPDLLGDRLGTVTQAVTEVAHERDVSAHVRRRRVRQIGRAHV